jgi:von Willebrand factor type A domain
VKSIRRYFIQAVTFSFVFSSWCGIVAAQSEPCIHRTIIASLTDRDWAPIRGVQRNDLVGEFRGKSIQLLSLTPDEGPHRIVILLDASGSLNEGKETGPAAWNLSVALASHIVEAKLERTELALIIFNERIIEILDFDSGQAKLAERLRQIGSDPNYRKLNVKGKTALWDAADEALARLGRSNEIREIYAITDGGDNASRTKEKELHHRLAESRTRMFAAMVQAPIQNRSLTPEELEGPQTLTEMVTQSGGVVFGPVMQTHNGVSFGGLDRTRALKLGDALTNFYHSMESGFRVEIEIPLPSDRWSLWKLDLSKPARTRFRGYHLGFTSDISPCLADSD